MRTLFTFSSIQNISKPSHLMSKSLGPGPKLYMIIIGGADNFFCPCHRCLKKKKILENPIVYEENNLKIKEENFFGPSQNFFIPSMHTSPLDKRCTSCTSQDS